MDNFQKCAREQLKSTREQEKKCPWTSKVAVNHANCVPVNFRNCLRATKKVPVNHTKVPVKTFKKVPVNEKMCPWKLSKKWGSRKKKTLPSCSRTLFWHSLSSPYPPSRYVVADKPLHFSKILEETVWDGCGGVVILMFCHILPGNISPIIRAYDIPRTGVCTKKTHPVIKQIRIVLPRFMNVFLPIFCNSLSNQHFLTALR